MPSVVMLDSSVLIGHFRAKDKAGTFYSTLLRNRSRCVISTIAKMEIMYGVNEANRNYWNHVFELISSVPFTDAMVSSSLELIIDLKRKSLLIDMEDIMIAASAILHELPLATLNRKHFERIDGLKLVYPE